MPRPPFGHVSSNRINAQPFMNYGYVHPGMHMSDAGFCSVPPKARNGNKGNNVVPLRRTYPPKTIERRVQDALLYRTRQCQNESFKATGQCSCGHNELGFWVSRCNFYHSLEEKRDVVPMQDQLFETLCQQCEEMGAGATKTFIETQVENHRRLCTPTGTYSSS